MGEGEFPDGKMNEEDEGGLVTAIGIENGRVIIRWPKPVAWVAFDPDTADKFADTVKVRAQEARELSEG